MSRLAVSSARAVIDLERPLERGGRVLHGAAAPGEIAKPQAAAASSRLFYGWVMVPLAMAVMIASAPGQTYGFMSFNRSLRDSLSLSQTEFSGIYLLATLCAGGNHCPIWAG